MVTGILGRGTTQGILEKVGRFTDFWLFLWVGDVPYIGSLVISVGSVVTESAYIENLWVFRSEMDPSNLPKLVANWLRRVSLVLIWLLYPEVL